MCAMAQGENARHEISMSAGIMTNQAYDTRLTYQYYLNKSIGMGASFGYYTQWYANYIPQSELHHGNGTIGDYQKRIVNHRISI